MVRLAKTTFTIWNHSPKKKCCGKLHVFVYLEATRHVQILHKTVVQFCTILLALPLSDKFDDCQIWRPHTYNCVDAGGPTYEKGVYSSNKAARKVFLSKFISVKPDCRFKPWTTEISLMWEMMPQNLPALGSTTTHSPIITSTSATRFHF